MKLTSYLPTHLTDMDTVLWDHFAGCVYGEHPWTDFAAYCHLGTHMTTVATPSPVDGAYDHWYLDDVAGTAHYVGDTCGAYVFGDFMCPAFAPVGLDWAFTYTWTTDAFGTR